MRDVIHGIPEPLLRSMSPQHLATYAKAMGWRRVQTDNSGIALFAHPDQDRFEQLVIPRETNLDDFSERMAEILYKLADAQQRPVTEVMHDAMLPSSDTIRFAWEGAEANAGSIGLSSSIGLIQGCQRALLAAACSVINPVKNHPRMSLAEADQLIDSTRLHHTEYGSFVIAVTCPVSAALQQQTITGEVPFARQATTVLMSSVHRLVQAVENDQVDQLCDQTAEGVVPVTANLCDAILRMQPDRNDALRISAAWAPTLPQAQPLPRMVRVRRDYIEAIATVRDRLRPQTETRTPIMVGTVESLNGTMGEDGQRRGEVALMILHEEEQIRVRVELDPAQYADADRAHMTGAIVQLEGTLSLGRRVHRISNLQRFRLLESQAT